jgi:hypothetical protein
MAAVKSFWWWIFNGLAALSLVLLVLDFMVAMHMDRSARAYLGSKYYSYHLEGWHLDIAGVPVKGAGVVILATLPTIWMCVRLVHRLRQRQELGLCAVCGYDLRATPDRCPECGTIPEKPPPVPE